MQQDAAAGGGLRHMETSDSLTSSSGGTVIPPLTEISRHRGALLGSKASSSLTAVDALHLLAMYLSAIMHDYDHRCVIILTGGGVLYLYMPRWAIDRTHYALPTCRTHYALPTCRNFMFTSSLYIIYADNQQ